MEDIQAYRASYNEVWGLFHQGEVKTQELRNQGLSDRLDAIAQSKADMGNQLGKSAQVEACVNHSKRQLKDKITSLLA